uniref:non-specific serine/threonine protein kinase n=1 Tax=Panagrolaimus superbus TaxID=310955 RepID=A0A914YLH5_9BILA
MGKKMISEEESDTLIKFKDRPDGDRFDSDCSSASASNETSTKFKDKLHGDDYDSDCSSLSSASDATSTTDDDAPVESEQEPENDYENGGYHPVSFGDVFHSRYFTMRKLGWGHFATVWLAFDTRERIFTAIKIPKSRQDFIEASRDELDILQVIRDGDPRHVGAQNVVQILNEFEFFGVSKSLHLCMVFEVLGDNLLTLLRRFNTLNLNLVRVVSKQLLQGLAYLHDECEIIHTDIKPENVVICLTEGQLRNLALEAYSSRLWDKKPKSMISTSPEEYRSKYILGLPSKKRKHIRRIRKKHRNKVEQFLSKLDIADSPPKKQIENGTNNANDRSDFSYEAYNHISSFYEELQAGNLGALKNCTIKIVDFGNACYIDHHYSDDIQTREYRSPEVIIGCEYDTSADLWSAACLIFELVSGDYLFYPEASDSDNYNSDDDHIAKIIETLGPLPVRLFRDGRRFNDIFDKRGKLLKIKVLSPVSIGELLIDIASLPGIEARDLSEFLMPMLQYDINERATASECLKSKWLKLCEIRGTTKPKRRDTIELV